MRHEQIMSLHSRHTHAARPDPRRVRRNKEHREGQKEQNGACDADGMANAPRMGHGAIELAPGRHAIGIAQGPSRTRSIASHGSDRSLPTYVSGPQQWPTKEPRVLLACRHACLCSRPTRCRRTALMSSRITDSAWLTQRREHRTSWSWTHLATLKAPRLRPPHH